MNEFFVFQRFFNDTELRSTQKQTIAVKQNIHTLTVNRADLTDAGEFSPLSLSPPSISHSLVGVYKAVADNGSGTPVETMCTLIVGSKSSMM